MGRVLFTLIISQNFLRNFDLFIFLNHIRFEKRLLHPGANTNDIIGQYINTIKALQVIDGTGISIERVSVPICEYLQKREDTIRTIVTMFTDDTSELYQELSEMDKVSHIDDDLDNDDWVPAPTDALPSILLI